ncbi:MAG: saccharopine dehydrogenase NADP-binding domain-containing protein, partial [Planctomycetes bacterium]|nr:saccharopine dehydrogenase NADP-binding domain-containing protein [Planctomycetota bacterium]
MIEFTRRVLFVGYGSVAQCTLPILVKHIRVPPANITVMDFEDRGEQLRPWTDQGVNWVRHEITPENLSETLGRFLAAGDLLIDLAWNIDCCEIVQWCHDHGVLYINTSVEVWDPYSAGPAQHPTERTLYWRHMNVRRMTASWDEPGPTAVLEHGANPGLISHFTKQALLDIAAKMDEDGKLVGEEGDQIRQLAADRTFNELAMKLGVRVIHCSERDTQISNVPKQV